MKSSGFFQLLFIFLFSVFPASPQQPKAVFDQQTRIDLLAFSTDGKLLAAKTGYDFKIYSSETGKTVGQLRMPSGYSANSIIFSKDGKMLITGNNDGKVRIWDTQTFSLMKTLPVTNWSIYNLAISKDGTMLAVDAADGTTELWDLKKGKKFQSFGIQGQRMSSISFSPDENYLATVDLQAELTVWSLRTKEKVWTARYSTQSPLIFCREEQDLAVSGFTEVKFLIPQNGKVNRSFPIPKEIIPYTARPGGMGGYYHGQVIVSPDCKQAAINNWATKTITLADIKTAKIKKVFNGPSDKESNYIVVFSPNGKFIAAGSTSGKIKVWQVE